MALFWLEQILERARLVALALAVTAAASCATNSSSHFGGSAGGPDASTPRVPGPSGDLFDGGGFGGGPFFIGDGGTSSVVAAPFNVEPSGLQTVTVTAGQPMPTITYTATLAGQPIDAGWSVDRGDVGKIPPGPSSQAVFSATGTTGGLVEVIAGSAGKIVQRQILVKIAMPAQNGANSNASGESAQIPGRLADLGAGGGVGGVGGDGLGGPVSNPATQMALANPTDSGASQGLAFLYPYDRTVFPRGILAPLLQWSWASGDADAVSISLKTSSGSFSWTGTFAAPSILRQTAGKFTRHPIPQDVWAVATNTAGGFSPNKTRDELSVGLVVAKGGKAYGPIIETWTIAPGRLEGTVYYNSYGTHLVTNSDRTDRSGTQFGAAVLAIHTGATAPVVVAGASSGQSGSGCRVCHVVAAGGSVLIAQHGDNYSTTSMYDLLHGNTETMLTGYDPTFAWAGLSADGALALTNGVPMSIGGFASSTQLYAFPPTSMTPLAATGLPANLKGATPAFSPDTKHVVWGINDWAPEQELMGTPQLVAMDFDRATKTFSNQKVLATSTMGNLIFPSFFATNDAVVFHHQMGRQPDYACGTDQGQQAQLEWSDLATGTASELKALNGHDAAGSLYLPTGPNNHMDDTGLNYEPTVNPISSGGYLWVVFTSRRLYGNVATAAPWQSDPSGYDDTVVANATTKKLWVAAIDLNATPGTDPSHPAFYLPAQELLSGNARGFWVLPPCKSDGASCMSGDECCNGYCEAGDGGLICTNKPPAACSAPQEKCMTSADCCSPGDLCINGFCALPALAQ